MALNNDKELYKKRIKQILLYVFLLFLFILNTVTFCRNISSNPQELINYKKPIDELKYFRNPLIGVSYYDKQGNIKIVVLPDDITDNPYIKKQKISFDADNIVFIDNILTQDKHLDFLRNFSKKITKENLLSENLISQNNVLIWFDNLLSPLDDFYKIKDIATTLNLKPKVFDLLNYTQIKKIAQQDNKTENLSVQQQFENLNDFVQTYNQELKDFIADYKNFSSDVKHFNDKASTIVFACNEKQQCEYFADFNFAKSLTQSLKQNLAQADKHFTNSQKRVFLLTKLEKYQFETEDMFLQSLDNSIGVIMQQGFKTGFLLSDNLLSYNDKEEFIKNLKLKAGLSPDYWSEDINIFYFKAVEVK